MAMGLNINHGSNNRGLFCNRAVMQPVNHLCYQLASTYRRYMFKVIVQHEFNENYICLVKIQLYYQFLSLIGQNRNIFFSIGKLFSIKVNNYVRYNNFFKYINIFNIVELLSIILVHYNVFSY